MNNTSMDKIKVVENKKVATNKTQTPAPSIKGMNRGLSSTSEFDSQIFEEGGTLEDVQAPFFKDSHWKILNGNKKKASLKSKQGKNPRILLPLPLPDSIKRSRPIL